MADDTLYDTPNGKKTLAQMQDGLHGAGWNGNYDDPASVIAAYNQTASGSGSKTGGSGNPAQDLLDAIASGDQTKFDEAVKEYQQTSSTNLATSLLGTASQLRGPSDYFKFNEYTSGGRNLWQQLFGSQPRPDFSAPTGPITPETITTLLQQLGMMPATPPPTGVNPQAPAGSVPANNLSPNAVNTGAHPTVTPPAPTTPLSGVAASVGAAPSATVQPAAVQAGVTPAAAPVPTMPAAQPSQGAFPPAATPAPTSTASTTSQAAMPGVGDAFKNVTQPIPLPYQINPAVWDSLGPVGQQLALSAAEAAGWDKNEYLRQINASRPQGTAPGASSTAFKTAVGAFS